jgi:anti-sigma factor RsiW
MTCREWEEMCGAWLDGELDLVRSLDLEAHARECARCASRREEAEALRDTVRTAPYHRAPESLRRRLRRPRRDWRWLAALPAAAAVLLAAYFVLSTRPSMAREAVDAHVRSLLAAHLLDVPSTDRHTVKPWFAGKLDYSPDVETPAGFELLGGRLDYLGGRPVAALVYRRRLHIVNVFVWPSGERNPGVSVRSDRGYQVVHWVARGMTWWAVSDLNAAELAELAR